MTARAIGWVTRGTPKTEEQQEAGGNGTLRILWTGRTREQSEWHSRRKERDNLECGRDERIILKRVLKTWNGRAWTECVWEGVD
jgi:hypothetical protein